jgi:NADPH:quinone reductase-like Zn-dependent oxidoreductase
VVVSRTILIQGGAGGVAGFAIQLAKHIGATVITTASAVIDYARGALPRLGLTELNKERKDGVTTKPHSAARRLLHLASYFVARFIFLI